MELKVEEIKALEPIKFNYEELKKWLIEKTEKYKNLVYTEENISLAKTDRADLNKLKRALNDEKTRIKNVLLEQYNVDFEPKIKELIEIVDKSVENVDKQVKESEQKFKDNKRQEIETFFNDNVGDYKDLIKLDKIFNDKWLNKTYKMSDIEKEIRTLLTRVKTHMTVIEGQEVDEGIKKQAKRYYFENVGNPDILTLTNIEIMNAKKEQEKIKELERKQEIPKVTESITENIQNVSKSEENITNNTQNITKTVGNLTKLDFSVWVTEEQAKKLKLFLVENNIKFGRVV